MRLALAPAFAGALLANAALATAPLRAQHPSPGRSVEPARPVATRPPIDTAPSVRWKVFEGELLKEARTSALRAASQGDSSRLKAFLGIAGLNGRMGPLLGAAMYMAAESARVDPRRLPARVAVAGSAAAVLVHFLPDAARAVERQLASEAALERRGGVAAARVDAAVQVGRAIGARTLEWSKGDGTGGHWTGTVPTGQAMWRSAPGVEPGLAERLQFRPWFLRSADQFRPQPPPAFPSAEFTAALEEVRRVARERTPEQTRSAQQWVRLPAVMLWDDILRGVLIRQNVRDPQAAHVLAMVGAVSVDAGIACTDAKYHYWLLRPTHADSTIALADGLPLPNFPSYPSGHACLSGAIAEVIGHYLPAVRAEVTGMAEEAALSRLYAGVHYRFDNDVGLQLGRQVARYAIAEDRAGRLVGRWR